MLAFVALVMMYHIPLKIKPCMKPCISIADEGMTFDNYYNKKSNTNTCNLHQYCANLDVFKIFSNGVKFVYSFFQQFAISKHSSMILHGLLCT